MLSTDLIKPLQTVLKSPEVAKADFHRLEVRRAYPFETDLPFTIELHVADSAQVKKVATALSLTNDRGRTNSYSGDLKTAKAHVLLYGPAAAREAVKVEQISVADAPAEEVAAEAEEVAPE